MDIWNDSLLLLSVSEATFSSFSCSVGSDKRDTVSDDANHCKNKGVRSDFLVSYKLSLVDAELPLLKRIFFSAIRFFAALAFLLLAFRFGERAV